MADQVSGPEPTNDTPPDTEPTTPPEPKTFDEGYVKELRSESAKYRKELRDTQKRLDEIQKAQEAAEQKKLEEQGEWQKLAEQSAARANELEAQIAQQEQQLANERRNTMAIGAATALGAIDPTDANFSAAVAGIDISDEGAAEKIQAVLEALKEQRPYLFQGKGTPNLASFNPAHGPQPTQRETREQRLNRIYGGGQSIFDTEDAKNRGGGVVITTKNLE